MNLSSIFPLLLLVPVVLFSQRKKDRDTSAVITQPDRIEFPIRGNQSEFYIVPGGTDGLLVVEETQEPAKGGGYVWKLHMIDTAFNVVWSRADRIPANGSFLGYEYFDGNFYLLFNKDYYRSEDLLVYQLKAQSEELRSYELTTVFPIEISHFESVGETLLLAGYANFRPVVITYNINDRVPKVVPGFYDNKNDILDLVVDEKTKLFTVIMSERMRNKKYTVRVKTFNDRGDIIQDNILDPGEKRSLLDGASTTFSGGLQYLAGTHSRKSLQYSQGFYLSKFINGQQQFNKYYPFAELSNFWDHLNPRREERILRKIEKKKEKGKIKKFNYRLLVHEILERDDQYIMIGEAYYPRYNYSNTGGNLGGYAVPSFQGSQFSNPYFLGYKFTHAVVVGFDRNCNILWDHTFKIEDIQSFTLDKNVAISGADDRVVLMYLEENEIRSKVIEGEEVVEGRTFNPVKLSFESDELKNRDPSLEKIEEWYGETLFAYGEQSIVNTRALGGESQRKVFYINKIQYKHQGEPN
ncbi:MAG: hypothetical protein AAF616_05875 [Bacteroidota bacterium]